MIDYDPHSWYKLIFNNDSKNIFKQLWPPMLILLLYTTALVVVFIHVFENYHYPGATAIHSLLGVMLGLFLVFRTNTAYDRWWEGRKQWGGLVNVTRNLAAKLNTLLGEGREDDKKFFAIMISNFVFAMKEHLRDGVIPDEISEWELDFKEKLASKGHQPLYIVNLLYERLTKLNRSGVISGEDYIIIDQELRELMNLIGACERIKNTPIPYSYNMFIKKFIFLYSVTLPFGIISITHYWTIPIVVIIFYLLVSTELIAEEIEDPFGKDENDLPTDILAVKIKANVEETLL